MPIDAATLERIKKNDPSLTSLYLSHKNLTDADIFVLCEALKTNDKLTTLDLSNNKIRDAGAAALIQNNNLVKIILSSNQIVEIGQNVVKRETALTYLDLSYNRIESIGEGILNKMIISLDISYNKINNDSIKILSRNKTLKTLRIGNSEIEDPGIEALAQSTTLTGLVLTNGCKISFNNAKAFRQNNSLLTLAIIDCSSENGVIEALLENKQLEKLEITNGLCGNPRIENNGRLKNARVIAKNTTLLELTLGNCGVDNSMIPYFVQNTTLTRLYLHNNQVNFVDKSKFLLNKTLLALAVSGKDDDYQKRDYSFSPTTENFKRAKALIIACEIQDLNAAEHFLKQGSRLYWCDTVGAWMDTNKYILPRETLLHHAVRKHDIQLLNLLLLYATDTERRRRNNEGFTYVELAQQLNFLITNTHDDKTNNASAATEPSFLENLFSSMFFSQPLSNAKSPTSVISQTVTATTTVPQQIPSAPSANIEKTSPTLSKETTTQLTAAGMDIPNTLTVISTLQTKHEVLLKSLADWETRAQQNAEEQAELEEIAQEPEVKAYYQMLKTILAQSFLAATVIASGKIDGNTGVGIKAINGLSTLSAAASSASAAVFPLAAPILGFFKVVSSTVSSTLTYREMQQHVKWVELEEIPQFAATLARRLALAQKRSIPLGISRADETTWTKIKNECGLFIEQLKSGTTFSSGEKRALLDAQLLFEYILSHERPLDTTLSGRINILLQRLVGAQATKTSSVSANNNAIVIAQNNQPDITQLLKEIAALKEERAADQQSQQEQARRLQELHDKIRTLQEQQTSKVASNHFVNVGGGQMQVTMQIQDSTHASSSATGEVLSDVYKQLAKHEEAVAELGRQAAMTQEQLAALEKAKENNDENEENHKAGIGNCFTM